MCRGVKPLFQRVLINNKIKRLGTDAEIVQKRVALSGRAIGGNGFALGLDVGQHDLQLAPSSSTRLANAS